MSIKGYKLLPPNQIDISKLGQSPIVSQVDVGKNELMRLLGREALVLESAEVYVVRYIHPHRKISNQEIAEKGLKIGNDLDKEDSPVFHFGMQNEDGISQRQYRMYNGWPVYVCGNSEDVGEKYINSKKYNEGILYVQKIDLRKTKLFTNSAMIRSDERGYDDVELDIEETSQGFMIKSKRKITELLPSLQSRFSEDGYLLSLNGEFFLRDFQNMSGNINEEKIFRYDTTGITQEITKEVKELRK